MHLNGYGRFPGGLSCALQGARDVLDGAGAVLKRGPRYSRMARNVHSGPLVVLVSVDPVIGFRAGCSQDSEAA